jgi:hypothetical protein
MGNNLIKVCAGIGVFAGLFVAHSCGESAGRGEIKELERTYSDSLATVRGLHSSDKALLKMYHEGRRDTITVTETVGVTETIDTPEALAIIVQQKEDLTWYDQQKRRLEGELEVTRTELHSANATIERYEERYEDVVGRWAALVGDIGGMINQIHRGQIGEINYFPDRTDSTSADSSYSVE